MDIRVLDPATAVVRGSVAPRRAAYVANRLLWRHAAPAPTDGAEIGPPRVLPAEATDALAKLGWRASPTPPKNGRPSASSTRSRRSRPRAG